MTVEYQKVWTTMNDLEMVTSKICSAREIIDNAIDAIQEHKSDKAELLMTAAYEYLEYYLKEFDDKFKDAWQATVGDLRDGDVKNEPLTCDKDDPSPECQGAWNSFWDSYQGSTVSSVQYTDEELNAMCDAAEEKHSKHYYDYTRNDPNRRNPFDKEKNTTLTYDEAVAAGWEMTADGFWMPPNKDKVKKWVLPVEECKDVDTDETEYFVSFPDDLLEASNLKEGDQIEWVDQGDGSYLLRKVDTIMHHPV